METLRKPPPGLPIAAAQKPVAIRRSARCEVHASANLALADGVIRHVSDTAFWVAAVRELEGQRPDAAFDDRLAALLVGERGRAIARAMPRAAMFEWAMIIRTSAIDRLIHGVLDAGVDTVLNLGAGLDTRPYRLRLPPSLRWVEVDYPDVVNFKNARLAQCPPACLVERIGLDLLDRPARQEILTRYAGSDRNVLVITEGVLTYFTPFAVATLASDLGAIPAVRFWIQDFDNAGRRRSPRGWDKRLKAAPDLFQVTNWFEFFRHYGWHSTRVITHLEESLRLKRPYPRDFPFGLLLRLLPAEMGRKILSLHGAAVMQSATPSSSADPPGR